MGALRISEKSNTKMIPFSILSIILKYPSISLSIALIELAKIKLTLTLNKDFLTSS